MMKALPFSVHHLDLTSTMISPKRGTTTIHMLSHYQLYNTNIVVGLIGKEKLPMFATIIPSFTELLVMPFSGLPFPLLYTTSTFKMVTDDVTKL